MDVIAAACTGKALCLPSTRKIQGLDAVQQPTGRTAAVSEWPVYDMLSCCQQNLVEEGSTQATHLFAPAVLQLTCLASIVIPFGSFKS